MFCLVVLILGAASVASAVPVFEPKTGATLHKSPGGQQIPVPHGILLMPINGFVYDKGNNGWCKWKLVNPRGATVNPSTAWVKCSMTGRPAGQM
jgi:hypothetical protein